MILCSFYGHMLCYQNIKYLFWTETTALFIFGVQMMQLYSENKTDFTKMIGIFGRYGQIWNDYSNLCVHEVTLSYQL
jgi:geranylgeranyl diphosphate synthase type 3